MATSSRRSSAPVLPISSSFISSIPPASTFSSTAATAFASSSSTFSSSSSAFSSSSSAAFFHRSSSPTRVNIVRSTPFSSSIRFSSSSPSRSLTFAPPSSSAPQSRRTCMCSPTTHPGSFRCSLHKGFQSHDRRQSRAVSSPSYRLNARRSAMTNSLVRIGTVEGDLVKRALAALIRPSSHQQRRRSGFQPRPSRLSVMSQADDL